MSPASMYDVREIDLYAVVNSVPHGINYILNNFDEIPNCDTTILSKIKGEVRQALIESGISITPTNLVTKIRKIVEYKEKVKN